MIFKTKTQSLFVYTQNQPDMKNCILLCVVIAFAWGCKSTNKTSAISNKTFKNNYAKVTDSLYAGIGEVSNQQYNQFLQALLAAGNTVDYEKNKVDSAGWRKVLAFNEPMVNYYHSHPVYRDYPVVNISYENAMAYCQWLTDEYNKNPKRNYKKVVFRLPTEGEWELAARGGNPFAMLPWYGIYMRNKNGEYMANFVTILEVMTKDTVIEGAGKLIKNKYDEPTKLDGRIGDNGIITTPVRSYWKNGYGLYNMAGNVSEMLAEKGKTKGGNWGSYGYYLRIDVEDEFEGLLLEPSAKVGFRVFAEVVEK